MFYKDLKCFLRREKELNQHIPFKSNGLTSQPTISRFENSMDKYAIFKLSYAWVDQYVRTLKNRKSIIIDIDATDDPTHGNQQLSMFNGYYGQFMYNELFFHNGERGQITALGWQ